LSLYNLIFTIQRQLKRNEGYNTSKNQIDRVVLLYTYAATKISIDPRRRRRRQQKKAETSVVQTKQRSTATANDHMLSWPAEMRWHVCLALIHTDFYRFYGIFVSIYYSCSSSINQL
jgi:hypothetical protein